MCIISKWKIIIDGKYSIYLYKSKHFLIFRRTKHEWKPDEYICHSFITYLIITIEFKKL